MTGASLTRTARTTRLSAGHGPLGEAVSASDSRARFGRLDGGAWSAGAQSTGLPPGARRGGHAQASRRRASDAARAVGLGRLASQGASWFPNRSAATCRVQLDRRRSAWSASPPAQTTPSARVVYLVGPPIGRRRSKASPSPQTRGATRQGSQAPRTQARATRRAQPTRLPRDSRYTAVLLVECNSPERSVRARGHACAFPRARRARRRHSPSPRTTRRLPDGTRGDRWIAPHLYGRDRAGREERHDREPHPGSPSPRRSPVVPRHSRRRSRPESVRSVEAVALVSGDEGPRRAHEPSRYVDRSIQAPHEATEAARPLVCGLDPRRGSPSVRGRPARVR
jgi:hypothetical protein